MLLLPIVHPGALRPYQSKMFDWYGFYHISQLFFSYQSTFFHISQTFFHISQRNLSYQSEFGWAYQSKLRVDISRSTFDCNGYFQSDAFSYQLKPMDWYHKGPYQLKNMTDMVFISVVLIFWYQSKTSSTHLLLKLKFIIVIFMLSVALFNNFMYREFAR